MADLAAVSKHKRPPLPGAARPPPFRADPVIDRALGRPSSVGKMLQGAPHPPRGEPTTDASLMSSMMARLSALEKQVQQAQRDMAQKDEVIRGLNATVADLKMSAGACSDEETEALRREYKRMQKRVHDMETFLADYGMVWVGASDSDEESPPSQAPPQAPPKETKTWNPEAAVVGEFVVDYDKIIKNIEELNVIAGEGIAAIRSVPGGARLQAPESVPLRLYANGILMYAGPFRPFTDETAQSCVRDLMEGYFPWELKERYPDGVPLQIFDHRHESQDETNNINTNNINNNNIDPSYNSSSKNSSMEITDDMISTQYQDKTNLNNNNLVKKLQFTKSQLISYQIRAASAAFADILPCNGNKKRNVAYASFNENEKRTFHILSERQRRHDLKKLFENLRNNIPDLEQKQKASKLNILKTAVEHLAQIAHTNERLQRTFQRETLKQKQLMQYLRSLETDTFLDLYSNNNALEPNDNNNNSCTGIM